MIVAITHFEGSDPAARIAQGLITGIGFLGAGTILHAKKKVMGLTTAASIWAVCLIGISVGLGHYFASLLVTVAVTLLLLMDNEMFFKKPRKPKK